MNFKLNPKLAVAGAVAAVAIIGATALFLGSGSEKQSRAFYESLKEDLGITDKLAEGEVSYSLLGGTLNVDKPVLKIIPEMDSQAQGFLRSFIMMGSLGSAAEKSPMAPYFAWLMKESVSRGVALHLGGESMALSRSGDSEAGAIEVTLKGVTLDKPFLSVVSGELVSAADVADEIRPADQISSEYGSNVSRSRHEWGHNMVNHVPGMGNWLINSTGAFGATVDASLLVERQSSGKGSLSLTIVHKIDGSEIGKIRRVAHFESLPPLDEMSTILASVAKSTAAASVWRGQVGSAVLAASVEAFARKAKVSEYELLYEGYELLENQFKESRLASDDAGFAAFCKAAKLETEGVLKAVRKLDDSECGIARKLIEDGGYSERYEFQEGKTLFAELMVNKGFKVEVN